MNNRRLLRDVKAIKFSKPCVYKGIEMRSRLEAKIANFFDMLGIAWQYEPMSFLLSNGDWFLPDFLLPELKTWAEVKGEILDFDHSRLLKFVSETKNEILIISKEEGYWHSCDRGSDGTKELLYLGKCSKCGEFFFCGQIGSYHCRKCGFHNGDGDIIYPYRENFCFEEIKIFLGLGHG